MWGTVRQAAVLLGMSRSEAGRLRQQALAEGLLEEGGEGEDQEAEIAADGARSLN
jgi:hypothetical protein